MRWFWFSSRVSSAGSFYFYLSGNLTEAGRAPLLQVFVGGVDFVQEVRQVRAAWEAGPRLLNDVGEGGVTFPHVLIFLGTGRIGGGRLNLAFQE